MHVSIPGHMPNTFIILCISLFIFIASVLVEAKRKRNGKKRITPDGWILFWFLITGMCLGTVYADVFLRAKG